MVVASSEICALADVIFIIEGTAINGAYLNDIKTNYIIPTLEYFNQGNLEERDYVCESTSALYGIVVYHAADRLPSPSTDIYGPYSNPHKVLQMLDKIELVGGRGESHANVAEGLASSLICLDDLQQRREPGLAPQRHCILISNSPPYMMPVVENQAFTGNTAEQLASLLNERNVHLSILSPRKIPAMFKLFEKAGGDLSASQNKNYAKDPRHLVLLKGFSLKERPVSPTGGAGTAAASTATAAHNINVASLSSPLPSHGSPMASGGPAPQPVQPVVQTQPTIMQTGPAGTGVGVVTTGPPPTPVAGRGFPPAYGVRPGATSRWPMMPPQGPRYPGPGSALIEQLNRPPTAIPPQFNNSAGLNPVASTLSQQQTVQQQQTQQQAVQQQNQQAAAQQQVAASQQQQQLRMLGAQGVQGVPGVMGAPQQGIGGPQQAMPPSTQGLMGQQQNVAVVMPQPNLLAQSQQMTPSTVMQQQQQQGTPLGQQQPQQSQVSQSDCQSVPFNRYYLTSRDRITIWQGILEYIDKKHPTDSQKLTRHVPCSVSTTARDGEPELKADLWPQKLIMQLMPKQLIGNIGGAYLKNSKSVLFHPQQCEALEALTKVMSTGFAGCVHFTNLPPIPHCDLKVLILLYTPDKRAYLGFIPNDQTGFVDRLRKVIQQQKTTNALNRQAGGQAGQPAPGPPMVAPQPANPQTSMGGMLQQPPISQQQQTITSTLGAAVGSGGAQMMATMQQEQNQPQQQPQVTSQSGPFGSNHMVDARQENLVKIQRLRQNLEAAQQQELQYKQFEIMNQMKMQPLQDNMSMHGQAQEQYKAQLESSLGFQQEQQKLRAQLQLQQQQQQQQQVQQQLRGAMGGPGTATAAQPGQQRMMRPAISNNPGLRHLLQQPQYRLNMQQQMPRGAGTTVLQGQPGPQQQQFDDVSSYDFLN
ncbi:mediator complex subunit 25 isoform X1 [Rhodnius prolixus]|uniref:mediator complex subunit 25 isoform X1 n=1 Tax=Rhodnius prolixus TaxID=13249 RepID=UPI003D18BA10